MFVMEAAQMLYLVTPRDFLIIIIFLFGKQRHVAERAEVSTRGRITPLTIMR